MNEHRALYVGISRYSHTGYQPLTAPGSDACALQTVLSSSAYEGQDPMWGKGNLLVGESTEGIVNEQELREEFNHLLKSAIGDDLLFYFAGHGATENTKDGFLLVTSDDNPDGERHGLRLQELIDGVNGSGCRSAVIILDCCGAGHVAQANVAENVVIIAAAQKDQDAGEKGGHGVFTTVLLDGLQGRAADLRGNISAISLYDYVSGTMSVDKDGQTPVLKAQLTAPVILRKVKAKLSNEDLRDIEYKDHKSKFGFSWLDQHKPLNPDFEATEEETRHYLETVHREADKTATPFRSRDPNRNIKKDGSPEQQAMDYYKRLRDAGLLRVIDESGKNPDHSLYWACMNRGSVELTELGRYYWELVTEDRLIR